ncbi:MAG TPA: ABC transporter ATP-binding protein [Candidatus Mediterraneibacter guildfordensis]|nr:ABC transporter ATP-binding protein [Candidatus Mediterraneibacter guildfordensis]
MEPILKIEHLSVSFTQYDRGARRRQLHVVKDLSLAVMPGQIAAVVGASGSGKSLLAHSILGILPYNSRAEGTILYDGEPLTQERAKALRGREIFLIPQGVTYLDPLMKVGPQLRKGRKDAGTKERCRAALLRYGLGPETEELYPFELSGGMARRVLIASAMTEKPRLIIADEPTPGLDARSAKRILGHFRELADEGAGILFITHDLELALTVADDVTVFYEGETIEQAKASDFEKVENLRHPYTRALWHAMPEHGFRVMPDPEDGT